MNRQIEPISRTFQLQSYLIDVGAKQATREKRRNSEKPPPPPPPLSIKRRKGIPRIVPIAGVGCRPIRRGDEQSGVLPVSIIL